jgi:uncharacterized protein YkwD
MQNPARRTITNPARRAGAAGEPCMRCVPTDTPPGARQAARREALARLFRQAALGALSGALSGALTGALTACGGGGGGGDSAAPSPAAATPATSGPLAAVLSVPAPVGYDAARLAAFNRLNEIRLSAGLGMLAQNVLLDQAAQAHADWEISNDTFSHVETAGTSGFTGAQWWNRAEAAGYVALGGSEVMTGGLDPASAIDGLVNVAYHRAAVLAFEPVDIGIGWSTLSTSSVAIPVVIDITSPETDVVRRYGQSAQASINGVAIWPLDGAQGVLTHMGVESPDPVPAVDVASLGTPASVTVGRTRILSATSFVMRNATNGTVVPASLLNSANDPNGLIPPSNIVLVPLAPLDANASYNVEFVGSFTEGSLGSPIAITRSWIFSTGSR